MVALFVVFLFLFFVSLDIIVLIFQKKIHPAFEIDSSNYLQFSKGKNILNSNEIFFSPGHTWLKYDENGFINIGLDEFASKLLGNIPLKINSSINKQIKKGDVLFKSEVENKKLEFRSPIDGIVKSVNANTSNKNLNKNWILQIQSNNVNQNSKRFLTGSEALEWMRKEYSRLENFLNQHAPKKELAGATMFDGGTIAEGAIFNLPKNKIELFEKEFLSL